MILYFLSLSSSDDDDDDDLDEAQIQRRRDLMRQRALARAQVTLALFKEKYILTQLACGQHFIDVCVISDWNGTRGGFG